MLFMVIERYKNGGAEAVYRRFRERGRMMPAGLNYLDSWVEPNYDRCFQLMSCDSPDLFQEWTSHWDDLVDFEIVPVITSREASERVGNQT
jgi:Protein of unknown function (DUF3303)